MSLWKNLDLPAWVPFHALSLVLLLPFVLGIFLLESFLSNYRAFVIQPYRDHFTSIAERVEENLKPPHVLWEAVAKEFPPPLREQVTKESAPEMVARVKRALGIPALILAYDGNASLV